MLNISDTDYSDRLPRPILSRRKAIGAPLRFRAKDHEGRSSVERSLLLSHLDHPIDHRISKRRVIEWEREFGNAEIWGVGSTTAEATAAACYRLTTSAGSRVLRAWPPMLSHTHSSLLPCTQEGLDGSDPHTRWKGVDGGSTTVVDLRLPDAEVL